MRIDSFVAYSLFFMNIICKIHASTARFQPISLAAVFVGCALVIINWFLVVHFSPLCFLSFQFHLQFYKYFSVFNEKIEILANLFKIQQMRIK